MTNDIIINVSYECKTGYWAESYNKNKIYHIKEKQSLTDIIKNALTIDNMTIIGRPISNVFNSHDEVIGYVYKTKTEIEGKKVVFYAWVEIYEIKPHQDIKIIDL